MTNEKRGNRKEQGVRHIRKGEKISREEIRHYPVRVCGSILPKDVRFSAFESEVAFDNWAKDTEIADAVTRGKQIMAKLRGQSDEDQRSEVAKQEKSHKRFMDRINRLSEETGLHPTSRELLIKAATEEPESDPIVLFDKADYGGDWRILSGPWSDLGRILKFNNKASSGYVVLGTGVLCSGTWWRGDRLWFIGLPYHEIPNFSYFGFDNVASSALLF